MNASSYTTPTTFPTKAIKDDLPKKVVFCIPTISKPYQQTLDSLEASLPLIKAAGWDEGAVYQIGCPYISAARSMMLRKALDAKATVVIFIDHDLSWKPQDLLTLLETEGDVIAGTYRFKNDDGDHEYMGSLVSGIDGCPVVRASDGCIKALCVPAGFLKVTRKAVNKFMEAYPELAYGERCAPMLDLFNHGAHNHVWYGEDYAFSRNWLDCGGEIWVVPDLDLDHHSADKSFPGNFHQHMLRQDGGSASANPNPTLMQTFLQSHRPAVLY